MKDSDAKTLPVIACVLMNDQFIRNFVASGALDQLRDSFNITLLVSGRVTILPAAVGADQLCQYATNDKNEVIHFRILDLLTWQYRHRSSSFRYRLARRNKLQLSDLKYLPVKRQRILRLVFRILKLVLNRIKGWLVENRLVSPLYFRFLKSRLRPNKDLEDQLSQIAPTLILCPVSAFDPDAFEILRVARNHNFKTLFVVDNWDNVSSKSVYWMKPTHIAVWGQQSAEHAIGIHGFKPEQVSNIGTARYADYFVKRLVKTKSPIELPYVLFVGTALYFDEESSLLALSNILNEKSEIFGDLHIIYRPHPHRQAVTSDYSNLPNRVLLDPGLEHGTRVGDDFTSGESNSVYFSRLLSNAELVIGGLTSMLIEALIFGKQFIALVHDDGSNFTSQDKALTAYEHFKGLDQLSAVHFVRDLVDLERILLEVWFDRKKSSLLQIDSEREYFLHNDEQTYSQRLHNLVNDLVATDG